MPARRFLVMSCACAVALAFAGVAGMAPPARAVVAPADEAATPGGPGALPRLVGPGALARTPAAFVDDERAADPRARGHALAAAALARRFGGGGRRVEAHWNAWTGLPHRAWGAGVRVATGRLDDAASAEAAARAFLAAEPALWAGDERPDAADLALVKAHRVGATWFLVFQQRHRGVDVAGGRVDLRLRDDGTLVLLGSDWFPAVRVPAAARLSRGVADAHARAEIGFVAARDRLLDATTVIVPLPGADGVLDYRLAHRVRHRVADPPAVWVSHVDATTGQTLARENVIRFGTLSGTTRGSIRPASPTDPPEVRAFPGTVVAAATDSTFSGPAGNYALPNVNANFLVKSALRGPLLEVFHAATNEAAQTLTAPAGLVLDFTWTAANSDTAERDTWYHAHVAHDWVKAIDPGFAALDYRMPCTVNIASQCNAYWDGVGINFYRWGIRPSDGRACANTGEIADVVYHEYGHGRTQEVFAPFEPSGAMHEGLSDYMAASITGQPVIGRGFFGPGTSIRTTANTQRIDAASCLGEVHCVGNAVSGALWDLRGRLVAALGPVAGVARADALFHESGYGGATWHDDWLLDLLVVDDDDGTLLNGTPHFGDICAAFTPRGFACPDTTSGVWIAHDPLPDADLGTGSFPVDASIGSFAGAFDAASPKLSWRVNGGLLHDVAMTPLGGDQYRAFIPPMPAGGRVEYAISARDVAAGPASSPPGAPAALHAFSVGTKTTVWADDFETDRGWTSVIEGASTGRWMRVDPNGTTTGGTPPFYFSPEDDHTPGAGTRCFVTQDTTAGQPAGLVDVDGGCVTLVSPAIALPLVDNLRLESWHWFVDETRYDDTLSVAVSSDGGATWHDLERIYRSAEGWTGSAVDLAAEVTLPATIRLRLRTCDGGGGSLLEAALDDVAITTRVYGAVDAGASGADAAPAVSFLGRPAPNPGRRGAASSVVFGVARGAAGAAHAAVRLEVVDARGRLVRILHAGMLGPGRYARAWSGDDERGRAVAAGVYFVRLSIDGRTWREKVVRLD